MKEEKLHAPFEKTEVRINLETGQIAVPVSPGHSEWTAGFLQGLGYLLVQSNELEDALANVYWVATGKSWAEVDDDIRGLTLGTLIDRVTQVYEKRFPEGELRQRLENMKPTLKEALDTRNAFVHARWVYVPVDQEVERERLPRGQKGVRELLRLDMLDLEFAIGTVGSAAEQVMEELYDPAEVATRPAHGPRQVR